MLRASRSGVLRARRGRSAVPALLIALLSVQLLSSYVCAADVQGEGSALEVAGSSGVSPWWRKLLYEVEEPNNFKEMTTWKCEHKAMTSPITGPSFLSDESDCTDR